MTRIGVSLLSAKAALELGPGELHDRRPSVHVVRGQSRVAECNEERAHFALRKLVARLYRGLARHGRGKPLVLRVRRAGAITDEGRQRLAQTPLGVEPRMRIGTL
jgi:hypothetical protein